VRVGHCRRRKIRCLLANEDPGGRCANCIRLKKECNFYPVEHQPDGPGSQTATSKDGSIGQPETPTTSSPRHPSVSGERVVEFRAPFPGPPSVAQTSTFGFQDDEDSDSRQAPTSRGSTYKKVMVLLCANSCQCLYSNHLIHILILLRHNGRPRTAFCHPQQWGKVLLRVLATGGSHLPLQTPCMAANQMYLAAIPQLR